MGNVCEGGKRAGQEGKWFLLVVLVQTHSQSKAASEWYLYVLASRSANPLKLTVLRLLGD